MCSPSETSWCSASCIPNMTTDHQLTLTRLDRVVYTFTVSLTLASSATLGEVAEGRPVEAPPLLLKNLLCYVCLLLQWQPTNLLRCGFGYILHIYTHVL